MATHSDLGWQRGLMYAATSYEEKRLTFVNSDDPFYAGLPVRFALAERDTDKAAPLLRRRFISIAWSSGRCLTIGSTKPATIIARPRHETARAT
jgi:hypothetical protein